MGILKSWSSSIGCACAICVLIENILPDGKVSKSMQQILSTFILAVMFLPLSNVSLRRNFQDFKSKLRKIQSNARLENSGIIKKINRQIEESASLTVEEVVKKFLLDMRIRPILVKVSYKNSDDEVDAVTNIKCKIVLQKSDECRANEVYEKVLDDLKIKSEVTVHETN